jgi:hypothetical protein
LVRASTALGARRDPAADTGSGFEKRCAKRMD